MSFDDLKAKNQPAWLLLLLILIISGLLVFILTSKEEPIIQTDLERQIALKQPTIALFSKDGKIQLFNPKGLKIKPCGKLEDLKTVEEKRRCGIGVGTVVASETVTFEKVSLNPLCERDTAGGYVYWYHLDGPYEGEDPCHTGPH